MPEGFEPFDRWGVGSPAAGDGFPGDGVVRQWVEVIPVGWDRL